MVICSIQYKIIKISKLNTKATVVKLGYKKLEYAKRYCVIERGGGRMK